MAGLPACTSDSEYALICTAMFLSQLKKDSAVCMPFAVLAMWQYVDFLSSV